MELWNRFHYILHAIVFNVLSETKSTKSYLYLISSVWHICIFLFLGNQYSYSFKNNFRWHAPYFQIELRHEISNTVVFATSKGSDQPAHMRSLIRAFASRLNILWLLGYWPNIIWSFYVQKQAAQARLSLRMSKCHIVGNHMSRLIYIMHVFTSLVSINLQLYDH